MESGWLNLEATPKSKAKKLSKTKQKLKEMDDDAQDYGVEELEKIDQSYWYVKEDDCKDWALLDYP